MFSLLGKLRRTMFQSRSWRNPASPIGRYLVYTIGEVLLIMIGILLALQVSNWNDHRKAKSNDKLFLKNLRNELMIDTSTIDEMIVNYENINELIKDAVEIIKKQGKIIPGEYKIIARAIRSQEVLTPIQRHDAFSNTDNTQGRLEQINPELNQSYITYINEFQYQSKVIGKLGESLQLITISNIYPLVEYDLISDPDNYNVYFDPIELKNNRQMLNAFNRSYNWRKIYLDWIKENKAQAKRLLNDIEVEIQKD